ncbi:hypothetical protein HGRIS_008122 [Hohenbuehelia grisea]|uniref:Mg-dependent DNase n=1 Tax=Hohenbuehelia grisea TaxID=104357 RepID=A0ABR3J8F4_9AGAR
MSGATLVPEYRFIDIAVNLTDPIFRGEYRGKQKHEDDFDAMLDRSRAAGLKSMIVTGGSLEESKQALDVANKYDLYATVGCHPTRSAEFDSYEGGPEAYLQGLDKLLEENVRPNGRAVALGECGLDYDRLHFSPIEMQKKYFRSQLALAKKYHLPMFLHSRSCHADFVQILREEGFGEEGGKAVGGAGGVVHSFTGTPDEAAELMEMGFYLGINGCSMKTEENLKTARSIRLDRLMLETDAPWCSMTSTHASKKHLDTLPTSLRALYFPPATQPDKFVRGKAVKGRNEPCATGGVAWVMHKLYDLSLEEVAEQVFKNTVDVFGLEGLS